MNLKSVFGLLLIVILMIFTMKLIPWVQTQLAIDSCLDRGGRWDYESEHCIQGE